MKKQTAVEWLVEQIKSDQNQKALSPDEWMEVIEQAKAMEKEQIVKAAQDNFYAGQDLANGYKIDWNSAEQYYNETYKGGEQ